MVEPDLQFPGEKRSNDGPHLLLVARQLTDVLQAAVQDSGGGKGWMRSIQPVRCFWERGTFKPVVPEPAIPALVLLKKRRNVIPTMQDCRLGSKLWRVTFDCSDTCRVKIQDSDNNHWVKAETLSLSLIKQTKTLTQVVPNNLNHGNKMKNLVRQFVRQWQLQVFKLNPGCLLKLFRLFSFRNGVEFFSLK